MNKHWRSAGADVADAAFAAGVVAAVRCIEGNLAIRAVGIDTTVADETLATIRALRTLRHGTSAYGADSPAVASPERAE